MHPEFNPNTPLYENLCGKSVLIRTVTYFHTGRVVGIEGHFLVIDRAAWVADTGNFSKCLKDGAVRGVEPLPGKVRVNTMSMVDIAEWSHPLHNRCIVNGEAQGGRTGVLCV